MSDTKLDPFHVLTDPSTGQVSSVTLYGRELLDQTMPCSSELLVNGKPLALRPRTDPNQAGLAPHLKGEFYTGHFTGWALVVARKMGGRSNSKFPSYGIQTMVRREICDQTAPCPGPGGPVIEAPLWVDTLTVLGWNWKFWGEDTRMIFPSLHSTGPTDEWGHCGYENSAPEEAKKWMQNSWRRTYPGCMALHGACYHDARTGQWLAITCRRPNVGYVLNIEDAGAGVAYDFTFHTQFALGQCIRLPEIKLFYGPDRESMQTWLADYTTEQLQETPEWVHKTLWGHGLGWDNEPTWTNQADAFEAKVATGQCSAFKYSLVTDRPVKSGTTPYSYAPDTNHGTLQEFKEMGLRLKAKNIPYLVWMSHSGVAPGHQDIDDDWFIKGVDGRWCAAWGNIDHAELVHVNPGHPGYIEYTKRWIKFYVQECGAKGIFFDCLSWTFPDDFSPRPWMRTPGDTNLMALKFVDEIAAYLKELDPEAILLGEGTSNDFPVHVFSVHSNPVRSEDGMGPRDWLLALNAHAPKKMVIDQGPGFAPSSGMTMMLRGKENVERNLALAKLLAEHGGKNAWTTLPGEISYLASQNLLVFPDFHDKGGTPDYTLSGPLENTRTLEDITSGSRLDIQDGKFKKVPPGIYRPL